MATVKVTSEQAVLGDLPAVCVRSGAPADGYVTVITKVGGPSPWTLALLFFGPLGWLVLGGISLAMGEDLSVRLPFSASAWGSIRRVGLTGYVMLAAGVAGLRRVAPHRSRADGHRVRGPARARRRCRDLLGQGHAAEGLVGCDPAVGDPAPRAPDVPRRGARRARLRPRRLLRRTPVLSRGTAMRTSAAVHGRSRARRGTRAPIGRSPSCPSGSTTTGDPPSPPRQVSSSARALVVSGAPTAGAPAGAAGPSSTVPLAVASRTARATSARTASRVVDLGIGHLRRRVEARRDVGVQRGVRRFDELAVLAPRLAALDGAECARRLGEVEARASWSARRWRR